MTWEDRDQVAPDLDHDVPCAAARIYKGTPEGGDHVAVHLYREARIEDAACSKRARFYRCRNVARASFYHCGMCARALRYEEASSLRPANEAEGEFRKLGDVTCPF